MRLAIEASTKSKDGSLKFGAALVRPDKTLASMGFNGFPARIPDNYHILNDPARRAEKYPLIVHAEANCLRHRRDFDLTGYSLVVNGHPCAPCALEMASTALSRVYYLRDLELEKRWAESILQAKTIFRLADIELIEWQP